MSNVTQKTYYKWGDTQRNDFIQLLSNDIHLLYTICEENDSTDVTVKKNSEFITDRAADIFFKMCLKV